MWKSEWEKKSLQATRVKRINLSWTLFHHQKKKSWKLQADKCSHTTLCVQKWKWQKGNTKIYTLSGVSRKHIKKLIGCKFIQNMRERERSETGNYVELNEISLKFYADFHNMQRIFLPVIDFRSSFKC